MKKSQVSIEKEGKGWFIRIKDEMTDNMLAVTTEELLQLLDVLQDFKKEMYRKTVDD